MHPSAAIVVGNVRSFPLLLEKMAMPDSPSMSPRMLIGLIMGGLLLWGVYIGIGAYLYNHDPRRGVIVMISVLMFLGFWLLLLWNQDRIKRSQDKP